MILEAVILYIKSGSENEFERDFSTAGQYVSAVEGYIKHSLRKCIEQEGKYLLLIEWETLESHTVGFRNSPQYQEWKNLLHHYYDPLPVVEHYRDII